MSVRKEKYGSKKGEEGHEEKNNGFSFELECGEKAEKDLLTAVREGEGGKVGKVKFGNNIYWLRHSKSESGFAWIYSRLQGALDN